MIKLWYTKVVYPSLWIMYCFSHIRYLTVFGIMICFVSYPAQALKIEAGSNSYQITSGVTAQQGVGESEVKKSTTQNISVPTSPKKVAPKKPVTKQIPSNNIPVKNSKQNLHSAPTVNPFYSMSTLFTVGYQAFLTYTQAWQITSYPIMHGSAPVEEDIVGAVIFLSLMGLCFFLVGVLLLLFSRPLRFK